MLGNIPWQQKSTLFRLILTKESLCFQQFTVIAMLILHYVVWISCEKHFDFNGSDFDFEYEKPKALYFTRHFIVYLNIPTLKYNKMKSFTF